MPCPICIFYRDTRDGHPCNCCNHKGKIPMVYPATDWYRNKEWHSGRSPHLARPAKRYIAYASPDGEKQAYDFGLVLSPPCKYVYIVSHPMCKLIADPCYCRDRLMEDKCPFYVLVEDDRPNIRVMRRDPPLKFIKQKPRRR